MKIDSHQHFWKYNELEYGWIDGSMSAIRRDFIPQDLAKEINNNGMDGTISVQARQSIRETEWLLGLADENDFIRGIVGWLPLADEYVEREMERLCSHSKLKGLRHLVQEEADDFLSEEKFNRGFKLLKKYDLAFDILIFPGQLQDAIRFVDRYPEQVFILDHMAKPEIDTGGLSEWQKDIKCLAERDNVYCKVSGLTTEADWSNWTVQQLKPYFETVLDCFTPERLMFGSDWPVCMNACSYDRWVETVGELIALLTENEKSHIMGMSAVKAYKL